MARKRGKFQGLIYGCGKDSDGKKDIPLSISGCLPKKWGQEETTIYDCFSNKDESVIASIH